jgi:transposase
VRTAAEAAEQIEHLTGLKRGPTQIRQFLNAALGFRWRRTRVIPCPPKKDLPDRIREQKHFLETQLQPRLDEALAGRRHVFFVDAAHFVFGTFLCCLWSLVRVFVKAASGRQRFNVLGAWNAVARELVTITNTTVVNTDTMCEMLRVVAVRRLVGPVTLVLDNARYQRNALVMGLAKQLGIELLFLPSYSPNLNLIERLWQFVKRKAADGRYHPTFAEFRAAVQDVLDHVPTMHAEKLASLMTLNFQEFDDVSLLAA